MEKVTMKATLRVNSGKGVARTLRRQGAIPAVLYSSGTSTLLSMNPQEVLKKVGAGRREGVLISLLVEGAGQTERTAILKEMQWDPIQGSLLHLDLFEVAMDKPIRVQVPVRMVGIPIGVKNGGIVQFIKREVEIECLPSLIPDSIQIDGQSLDMGAHVYVKDLQLQEGITILDEEDQAILAITAPVSEAKLEELLAAAPPEAGKEPELLKKPVKEEVAEGKEGKKEEKG